MRYIEPQPLTPLEREVAERLTGGQSVSYVAFKLGRTELFVKRAFNRVCEKFDTRSLYVIERKLTGQIPEFEESYD